MLILQICDLNHQLAPPAKRSFLIVVDEDSRTRRRIVDCLFAFVGKLYILCRAWVPRAAHVAKYAAWDESFCKLFVWKRLVLGAGGCFHLPYSRPFDGPKRGMELFTCFGSKRVAGDPRPSDASKRGQTMAQVIRLFCLSNLLMSTVLRSAFSSCPARLYSPIRGLYTQPSTGSNKEAG